MVQKQAKYSFPPALLIISHTGDVLLPGLGLAFARSGRLAQGCTRVAQLK